MKRIFLLFILLLCSTILFGQTTTKYIISLTSKTTGLIVTGKDVDLYQSGVKKYDLSEEEPGVYTNSAVATGRYDVYVNGSPLATHQGITIAANKLTTVETQFTDAGKLVVSTALPDSEIARRHLNSTLNSILDAGFPSNIYLPDEKTTELFINGSDTTFGIKDVDSVAVANGTVQFFENSIKQIPTTVVGDTNDLKLLGKNNGDIVAIMGWNSIGNPSIGYSFFRQIDSVHVEDGRRYFDNLIPGKQWERISDLEIQGDQITEVVSHQTGLNRYGYKEYLNSLKITVPRIWGAHPDSSGIWNRNKIQQAVDYLNQGNGNGGYLFLDAIYEVAKYNSTDSAFAIIMKSGVKIVGGSQNVGTSESAGGFKVPDNSDSMWVVVTQGVVDGASFTHMGGIENVSFMLNGNNAGNTTQIGAIKAIKPGENWGIYNVQMNDYVGEAIYVNGSAPINLEKIHAVAADSLFSGTRQDSSKRIALRIHSSGNVKVDRLSGDASTIRITGWAKALTIQNWKWEAASHSDIRNLIHFDDVSGDFTQLFLFGSGIDNTSGTTLPRFIEITGDAITDVPSIVGIGNDFFDFDTLISNNVESGADRDVPLGSRSVPFMFYASANANITAARWNSSLLIPDNYAIQFYDSNNGWVESIKFTTGLNLQIRTPRTGILLEGSDGTDLMLLQSAQSYNYKPANFSDQIRSNKDILFTEMSAPSNPSSDTAKLYAQDDGSGNTLILVRFSNGDVDTLATSGSP